MAWEASYGADAIQQFIRQRMLDQIAEQERKRRGMHDDREFQLRQQEMQERRIDRDQERQDRIDAGHAAEADRRDRQIQTIAGTIKQDTPPGTSLSKPAAGILRMTGNQDLVQNNPDYAFPPMLENDAARDTNIGEQSGDVYTGTANQQRQIRMDEGTAQERQGNAIRQAARDAQADADRKADNERADRALGIQQGQLDLARTKANTPDKGDTAAEEYSAERAKRTIDQIAEVKKDVGLMTTGLGSLTSVIPGTSARNFAAKLNSLKASIAFNELTQMRAASKTGGALGAVSDRETSLLQDALGSLDAGQSPEALTAQLNNVEAIIKRWQQAHTNSATPARSVIKSITVIP